MSKILKQWWFWVIVVVIVGGVCWAVIGSGKKDTNKPAGDAATSSQEDDEEAVGLLPKLDKNVYTDREGLVIFDELMKEGYNVTAYFQSKDGMEMTGQFSAADANSCKSRLTWDAYFVTDIIQHGDRVFMVVDSKSNDSKECPAGTVDDL